MRQTVNRQRFFCFIRVGGGKLVALGPYLTETDALNASNKIKDKDGEAVLKSYRTVDLATAKSQYKAELAQQTGMLMDSLRPIRTGKNLIKEQNADDYADVR